MTNKTKNKQKPEIIDGQVLTVEYGRHLIIPVYGENSAQDSKQTTARKLYQQYGEKHLQFSLTPICSYQEQMRWPEKPFLNVNVRGSLETTKDNWLGYIHPFEDGELTDKQIERNKYLKKLIKIGESTPLIITGKIIKEGGDYSMLLFASRKYIDDTLPKIEKSKKVWAAEREQKKKRNLIIGIIATIILVILAIMFWQTFLGIIVILIILWIWLRGKKK